MVASDVFPIENSPFSGATLKFGGVGGSQKKHGLKEREHSLLWLVTVNYSGWWFHIFFYFSPLFGKGFHFDKYFSDGLKPPTSHCC